MTIYFGYEKSKVLQALRYHFLTRKEIRIMIILVNVFALVSLALYLMKKIRPEPFFFGSFMWLMLMISFWFILPWMVYRRTVTFKHEFSMDFTNESFSLSHEKGSKSWPWSVLKSFTESPHFFHLYFDARSFILVPKNGCKGPDEVHELRKLIRDNVKRA
jgi:amino acid permease